MPSQDAQAILQDVIRQLPPAAPFRGRSYIQRLQASCRIISCTHIAAAQLPSLLERAGCRARSLTYVVQAEAAAAAQTAATGEERAVVHTDVDAAEAMDMSTVTGAVDEAGR